MTTKEVMDRILNFIQDLTAFYSELSEELPNLRIVVDNTRALSELKKMPKRLFPFRAHRRIYTKEILKDL